MSEEKTQFNIRILVKHKVRLKEIAKLEETQLASIVRKAMSDFISRYRKNV